jgi:hypothetical protein
MKLMSAEPAAIGQPTPQDLVLSGSWTAPGIGAIEHSLESVRVPSKAEAIQLSAPRRRAARGWKNEQ